MCQSHLSTPALSWDAILKVIKIKFQLISDPDMYVFFEKGMRGRVSYISNKHSKANNSYLKPKQIIYLDIINLCGHAMPKFLPTSGFKWIDPKKFNLNKYTSNSLKGCFLKVGLEYAK